MSRKPRNREADRAAIQAAANRLLAGTPLRSASGTLTATELITESGLRRDVVYEHPDLVDQFKAKVKTQHATPTAMQQLADDYAAATHEVAKLKDELARQRTTTSTLRKVIAELSLELEHARDELADHANVARLPNRNPHA